MNPSGSERFRKDRLIQMVDLAQVYRGCSKSELASMLDRDPAKIVPDSGNPKLDLVFNLADILDWPVGDVAEALWGRHQSRMHGGPERPAPSGTFVEIDQRAREAHRRGDYREMLWLGERLLEMAESSRERACAMTRIAGAWHGEGRFVKSLECFQAALAEPLDDGAVNQMLRVNVAFAHLYLTNLVEAHAIATVLLGELESAPIMDRRHRVAIANAHFICGTCTQRSLQLHGPQPTRDQVRAAFEHLSRSRDQYEALAAEFGDATYRGISNTCRAGVIELAVELNQMPALAALSELGAGLDRVIDPSSVRGDELESWGWWCVCGLCLALRHVHGEAQHRWAAIFSNKALELADASGSWALRERAFSLSYAIEATRDQKHSSPTLPSLDEEDVRVLVGTMGRFPRFRRTGWAILRTFMGQVP